MKTRGIPLLRFRLSTFPPVLPIHLACLFLYLLRSRRRHVQRDSERRPSRQK